jgi:hypothetical protein
MPTRGADDVAVKLPTNGLSPKRQSQKADRARLPIASPRQQRRPQAKVSVMFGQLQA